MFCPLLKNNCKETKCEWFDGEHCSIYAIADYLFPDSDDKPTDTMGNFMNGIYAEMFPDWDAESLLNLKHDILPLLKSAKDFVLASNRHIENDSDALAIIIFLIMLSEHPFESTNEKANSEDEKIPGETPLVKSKENKKLN